MTDEPWRATLDGVVVACRLTPKGGRDAIDGVARCRTERRVLLARVRAAPEDGRANDALCALMATSARRSGVAGSADGRREEPAEAGRGQRRSRGADRPAAGALTCESAPRAIALERKKGFDVAESSPGVARARVARRRVYQRTLSSGGYA